MGARESGTIFVLFVLFLIGLLGLFVLENIEISKSNNPVSACFAKAKTTEQMSICKDLAEKLNESSNYK